MPQFRIIDNHLHTSATIDGRMSEVEACERALVLGINELAFTNHVMLSQPSYTISPAAWIEHWETIQSCQVAYPQLIIRIGLEMDYYPHQEDKIATTIEHYEHLIGRPLDLVLGAIHEIEGVFFSNRNYAPKLFSEHDLVKLYRNYFLLSTKATACGLFDVMAHPDLIKKYSNDLTHSLAVDDYRVEAEKFVDALITNEVGLEVNTKGLKLMVKEQYPSMELINLYIEKSKIAHLEPIISVGSDAHKVDDLGFRIKETIEELRHHGVDTLMSFSKRSKQAISIA